MFDLSKVEHAVVVPEGKYWLGDPTIVFGEHKLRTPIANVNGGEVVVFGVIQQGKFSVNHTGIGMVVGQQIALIPIDMLRLHHINTRIIDYGHTLSFSNPVVCWQKDKEMDFGGFHLSPMDEWEYKD